MSDSRRWSIRVSAMAVVGLSLGIAQPWRLSAQALEPAKGVKYAQVSANDMKEWLTYLSSDELQGRQVFTEGYGLAAAYVADRLKLWGVKPLGDDGTYFENVKLKGYRVTRNSTVGVTVNGDTKTFKQGEHVTFGVNSGGKQSLSFTSVEFVGYGQPADLQGRDLKDKLVVIVPNAAPQAGGGGRGGRGGGRGGAAALASGAKAVVTFVPAPPAPTATETALAEAEDALTKAQQAVQQAQAEAAGRGGQRAGGFGAAGRGRGALPTADLTTVQKVDGITPPSFTGDQTFFDALFSGGPVKFSDILAKAQNGDPIPPMTLPAHVTVNIDNTFEVVSEQLTRNVAGMIEGSDQKLKDTYVMFGAHLDHIGDSSTGGGAQPSPTRCRAARRGRARGASPRPARHRRTPAAVAAGVRPWRRRRSIPCRSTNATSSATARMMTARARRRNWPWPRPSRPGR